VVCEAIGKSPFEALRRSTRSVPDLASGLGKRAAKRISGWPPLSAEAARVRI
jgi:hypothetical protein